MTAVYMNQSRQFESSHHNRTGSEEPVSVLYLHFGREIFWENEITWKELYTDTSHNRKCTTASTNLSVTSKIRNNYTLASVMALWNFPNNFLTLITICKSPLKWFACFTHIYKNATPKSVQLDRIRSKMPDQTFMLLRWQLKRSRLSPIEHEGWKVTFGSILRDKIDMQQLTLCHTRWSFSAEWRQNSAKCLLVIHLSDSLNNPIDKPKSSQHTACNAEPQLYLWKIISSSSEKRRENCYRSHVHSIWSTSESSYSCVTEINCRCPNNERLLDALQW